jgi:hypothetical protein
MLALTDYSQVLAPSKDCQTAHVSRTEKVSKSLNYTLKQLQHTRGTVGMALQFVRKAWTQNRPTCLCSHTQRTCSHKQRHYKHT